MSKTVYAVSTATKKGKRVQTKKEVLVTEDTKEVQKTVALLRSKKTAAIIVEDTEDKTRLTYSLVRANYFLNTESNLTFKEKKSKT